MRLLRKNVSEVSEAIFKEQRQLRKERLLASPGLIIGFVGFVIILGLAVLVPALSKADPNAMVVVDRLKPPGNGHVLGTDEFGRDLFVRLMYGARVSLWVGGCVAIFSCVLGVVTGIYASYFKILDHILMRICDGLIAIPGILLAIALIAALGTSSWNVVVALTIVCTPSVARTVRRGNRISIIFQDPLNSLSPVHTVEMQLGEILILHRNMTKKEAKERAVQMLKLTGIPNPESCMKKYPYELSGGMQQRVMIAMALACEPKLLIADEPTTALDVTIQEQILHLIRELNEKLGMSVLFITHDMGAVAQLCHSVKVMYLGQVVESAVTEEIFEKPLHPYTQGLLACIPHGNFSGGNRYRGAV